MSVGSEFHTVVLNCFYQLYYDSTYQRVIWCHFIFVLSTYNECLPCFGLFSSFHTIFGARRSQPMIRPCTVAYAITCCEPAHTNTVQTIQGKEPNIWGSCSVSILGKTWALVWFTLARFGFFSISSSSYFSLQCFDTVGLVTGRASGL